VLLGNRLSKTVVLMLFALLALSSLVMVGSVSAQSIPEPSVPEFTVKFVNASYIMTATNSYTGLDETELISNNSIEITITNQPFDYSDYQVFYNVRVKPHFEGNWTEVYPVRNSTSLFVNAVFSFAEYINDDSPPQSKSSFTLVAYPVVPTELYLASGYDIKSYYSGYDGQDGEYFAVLYAIPYGGQVDFEVEVLVGHDSQVWVIDHPLYPWIGGHFEPAVAYYGDSGWSNTQTITIGESQTSTPEPTSTPYTEPQSSEQTVILGVAVTVAVVCAGLGLLFYLIKRR
jgi:hypothetical protein